MKSSTFTGKVLKNNPRGLIAIETTFTCRDEVKLSMV